MQKSHILAEIRRTAEANGGVPLGHRRFYTETGIKETDWSGKYWARWGDAVKEAGYSPNPIQTAYKDEFLLEKFISLIRELRRYPVVSEVRMKVRRDQSFPSDRPYRRFGSKQNLIALLHKYCTERIGYEDVIEILVPLSKQVKVTPEEQSPDSGIVFGFVYLLKSGRYYKIGRSNAVGRRERELKIQLPEQVRVIHSIKTDDPAGIEHYWHRRFEDRRKQGEWFELSSQDIASFRRRKFM
jgi:hypothetical protein